jgi:hypothetical protein
MSDSAKLALHCGAREVTREELDKVPTPDATPTWYPVSHATTVTTVQKALTDSGFEVQKMRFGLSRGDARMFTTMDLASPLANGVSLAVGIRNSLDKSLPLGFVAGSRVFVCDNLAFRAELSVRRKHTRNGHLRFSEAICQAVRNLVQFKAHEAERVKRLMEIEVGNTQAESLMLRAYEKDIISHRALPGVILEWRTPSYPQFQERTAWSLHNAFTTILADRQKSNAQAHAAVTMRLGGLFDDTFGIKPLLLTSGEASGSGPTTAA